MIPAVSTACFYPLYTEEALRYLLDHGIHTVEIFFNCFEELEDDYIRAFQKMLAAASGTVAAVHPFLSAYEPFYFFTPYERRFEEGLRLYERFYRVMNKLDCRYLVFHGDHRSSQTPNEEYFERFYRIAQHARRYDVTILQENVSRCKSASTAFLQQFKTALGAHAQFTIDFKQAIRSGCALDDVVDVMGDGIRHVHCSDSAPGRDCLAPGEGCFDFQRYFDRIRGSTKGAEEICAVIELYRDNYRTYDDLEKGFCEIQRYM